MDRKIKALSAKAMRKGCCRCEIVVHSLPYEMSDRPQKSSIVIYK